MTRLMSRFTSKSYKNNMYVLVLLGRVNTSGHGEIAINPRYVSPSFSAKLLGETFIRKLTQKFLGSCVATIRG